MNRMIYRPGQANMGTIPGGPLGKAKYALASGRPDEAERICRKRLERYPNEVNTRVVLAQALLQLQQNGEALTEIRRALRDQPKNVEAQMLLASALTQQASMRGVPKEAEAAARRAVQLEPRTARTHVQLAQVLVANRDTAGAGAEAEEAIRLEPRNAAAHLIRAMVLLTDKDPDGAIQESDAALRYDRTLTQAEFIKANALIEAKRYDEALTSLDATEKQNPMMLAGGQSRMLRGRIYTRTRKFSKAHDQYTAARFLSGRLKPLAPALAWIDVALTYFFDANAQYAWIGLIVAITLLILFLLSLIPVAGPWIVAALVVALVGVLAFGSVRQLRGSILPSASNLRVPTLAGAVVVGVAGAALALLVIQALASGVFHAKNALGSPPLVALGVVVGVALAALLTYFSPQLFGRLGGRGSSSVAAAE